EAIYTFKHALVQDAAYDSLLKSRRHELHGKIAKAIEEQQPQIKETEPEVLAHHYMQASQPLSAVPLWQRAGELAVGRMALLEAISHFTRGLELLAEVRASQQRNSHELALRTGLGTALMALKGWAAQDVAACLVPALALARSLGQTDALLTILWGLWANVLTNGKVQESLTWVEQIIDAANTTGDANLLIVGHMAAMISYFYLGDLIQARDHGDRTLELYDQKKHYKLADILNHDPKTVVGGWASHWSWMFGYAEEA